LNQLDLVQTLLGGHPSSKVCIDWMLGITAKQGNLHL
jgi:hypothetical protein